MAEGSFQSSLALLRTRRFGTFWFASLLSSIGTWAQNVAQPWLLLSLGASSFLIGLDSFAMSAPVWLLTLAGGLLADRADRRRVIAGFQSLQMLCPLLIVILLLTGRVQPWMIILLSLVVGITDALSMPSFSSIVPGIVRRDQISAGLALNSTQFNISRIAGPAVAGLLMVSVGAVGCFALSALSYLPFIGVALWILPRRIKPPPTAQRFQLRPAAAQLLALARSPANQGALLTVFFSGLLCAPVITFCPVLVRDIFHGDAAMFSITVGAFGIGGLCGGIALLGVRASRDRRRIGSALALAFAITVALVAVNPWSGALPALLLFSGAAMSISNISANTLIQTGALALTRGQSVSLFLLAMRGGLALGSIITGATVTAFGLRNALLLNGLLAVIAQLAIARAWLRPAAVPAT